MAYAGQSQVINIEFISLSLGNDRQTLVQKGFGKTNTLQFKKTGYF